MSRKYSCDYCQQEYDLGDLVLLGTYSSHLQSQDICISCWMNSSNWPRLHTLSINSKYFVPPKFKKLPKDLKLVRQVTRYVRHRNSNKTIKLDEVIDKI